MKKIIVGAILLIAALCAIEPMMGVYPFGDRATQTVTIQRLYVDVSGTKESTSSHYMVGTDKGTFEVDNSLWLWLWNADELYSKLEQGKSYKIETKGRKVVNFLFQSYPGIVRIEAAP
jgi:hypothetical protein